VPGLTRPAPRDLVDVDDDVELELVTAGAAVMPYNICTKEVLRNSFVRLAHKRWVLDVLGLRKRMLNVGYTRP